MVILCADCAASLFLSEKVGGLKSKLPEESGETIDLAVECMECGKDITIRLAIPSSSDRPTVGKLKTA